MLFKLEVNRVAEPTSQLFLCIKGIDQIKQKRWWHRIKKLVLYKKTGRDLFTLVGIVYNVLGCLFLFP